MKLTLEIDMIVYLLNSFCKLSFHLQERDIDRSPIHLTMEAKLLKNVEQINGSKINWLKKRKVTNLNRFKGFELNFIAEILHDGEFVKEHDYVPMLLH